MSPTAAVIRELDARAVRASMAVVSRVTVGDLDRATPCASWSLGDLLAHMTAQHHGFAAAAEGNGADLASWQIHPLGDEPASTYAVAAERVLAAFSGDQVLEQEFTLPEFPAPNSFPAVRAIGFHLIDYVVHAWDVARSLDLPLELDQEVLDAALSVAREVPDGPRRLAPGAAFRRAVPAPAGAGTLAQVVAWLGRPPAWPS